MSRPEQPGRPPGAGAVRARGAGANRGTESGPAGHEGRLWARWARTPEWRRGGEAGYDARTSALTKWSLGAQYSAKGTTVAAMLADKGETAKACLAHELSADLTVGAEASHKIKAGSTSFTLGGAAKLNGATVKAKVDSAGTASALLETEVQPKAKMTISASCNALDLGKAPKVGISMDVKA